MKTTHIGIIEPEPGGRFTLRRVIVNWKRDGVLHTVTSPLLEDTAPPEKVACVLDELAHKIQRDIRSLPVIPRSSFSKLEWRRFVEDVNLTDRMLTDGALLMQYDPKLPEPGPTAPRLEFMGWKVFRR